MIQLLTEKQAADRLQVKPSTLAGWRRKGRSPAHCRLGRLVRYSEQWLEAFTSVREQSSGVTAPYVSRRSA